MERILRQNDEIVDKIEAQMLNTNLSIDLPLVHKFTEGMYIRQIFMPAGSLVTSRIHMTEHPYTVSAGTAMVSIDCSSWEQISAPYTGVTRPGTRRILYIIEDCIWTTYHRVEGMKSDFNDLPKEEIEKIVIGIENKILEDRINVITGTDVHQDYLKIIENKKTESPCLIS